MFGVPNFKLKKLLQTLVQFSILPGLIELFGLKIPPSYALCRTTIIQFGLGIDRSWFAMALLQKTRRLLEKLKVGARDLEKTLPRPSPPVPLEARPARTSFWSRIASACVPVTD